MTQTGIPVLMYHALEDEQHPAGAKDQGEQLYIVSVNNFRDQMQYLSSNGLKTYLLDELVNLDIWPQKAVVLTFDDGHESNHTLALPILQEFGFKAEFFITTGWIGTKHFLKPHQIVELHKAGMGIGSHSVSHPYFNDLSDKEIKKELNDSKTKLEDIISADVTNFSAPGGRIKGSKMISIAKNRGYKMLCTSRSDIFDKTTTVFSIPRFTMKKETTSSAFISMVNLNSALVLKIKVKTWIFHLAKQILGNSLYEIIRKNILNLKRTI